VPTGVQIVGRTYDDDTVFHVGAALERAGLGFGGDPGWRPPEPAGGIDLQGGEGP
jgi:Asp-tRNA(Asn)/Glu-tRNA(Gln) amidotransferase A subunit family amidase